MQVHVEQRCVLVQLLLILLPDPDHFPQDLHIKALPLRLGVDVFLILCECLDLLLDALDTLDECAELITRYTTWFTHRVSPRQSDPTRVGYSDPVGKASQRS